MPWKVMFMVSRQPDWAGSFLLGGPKLSRSAASGFIFLWVCVCVCVSVSVGVVGVHVCIHIH